MEEINITSSVTTSTVTTVTTATDDIRYRKPTTTKELKFFGTSFDLASDEGERRPATLKEIKFFGTSFDDNEKSVNNNNANSNLRHLNKFARTQSFGGSPKLSKPRKFFSPTPSPASSTPTISNASVSSLEKICENNIVEGLYSYNLKSNEKIDSIDDKTIKKLYCDDNSSENALDAKHGKRDKLKARSTSICIDKWQNIR